MGTQLSQLNCLSLRNSSQRRTTQMDSQATVESTLVSKERVFHDNKDSSYWLPKDEEEQDRLIGQHFAIKELYNGNLLSSVSEHLDFTQSLSILDAGCGSGSWIMDMVAEHPNCIYKGCDIEDMTSKNIAPDQVQFVYGDILKGLGFPDNTFDFVQMRMFILALREVEWPAAIKELIRVTKPGGIIQLIEVDLKHSGNSANVALMTQTIHQVCAARDQNPRIAVELEKMIVANENVKVIQSDYRTVDMASKTAAAKKFLWDWKHTVNSLMPMVGPKIGKNTAEEQSDFIELLIKDATTSGAQTCFNAVAAQKLY